MGTKSILKNKTIYFATLFATALFLFGYGSASAATLKINSGSTTLSPGDTATLNVVLNSEGIAVNNAEATITFPTELFDVLSISRSGSIFSLWVEEPYFSNSSGVITLDGGVPTPGFNGSNGPVVSIVVRAKKNGQAAFVFSSATVRANDGLGTDVLSSKQGKIITVVEKEKPVVEEVPVPAPSAVTLQITSPTHPNQNQWYKDIDPIFRWAVPSGVDAIQTTIDNSAGELPHVTYIPTIKEKSVKDLKDGIWYFKVRARKGGNWGPVSTYIVRIDNTIPEKKDVAFSYDDNKKVLNINAQITDETSGLDHYEIYINDILIKKVPSAEFIDGSYNLEFKTPGDNTVRLVAIDRAGNSVESSGDFHTTEMVSPEQAEPATSDERLLITIGSFSAPVIYIATLIMALVSLLAISAFYFGRHYHRFHRKFQVRAALEKGDHSKVLSLLKKRLEKHLEILQRTRHNRILSKEEKDIKEAIEGDLDEVDRVLEEEKEE